MKSFGDKAIDAMQEKAKQQQSPDAEGDEGSAMGAGAALTTEVLNLVDFAIAAKALTTKDAAGKEFDVCGANLRGERQRLEQAAPPAASPAREPTATCPRTHRRWPRPLRSTRRSPLGRRRPCN